MGQRFVEDSLHGNLSDEACPDRGYRFVEKQSIEFCAVGATLIRYVN